MVLDLPNQLASLEHPSPEASGQLDRVGEETIKNQIGVVEGLENRPAPSGVR